MYDIEGSDTGFEWIEIQNTGGSTVDISTWYFYENDTHHGLNPDGFSELESNERALIVQNFDNIYSEYGNALNLVKSSFSLNNTGESLSLSNEDKIIQSSVSYSSDDGALGDGNSLQLYNGSWVAATPTPGSANNSSGSSSSGDNDDSTGSNNSSSQENSSNKEYTYTYAHIDIMSQAVVHSSVDIEAYITKTKGNKKTKRLGGGVYYLNFGDGSYIESDQLIEVEHVYEYPGEYEIVFEFYNSKLAKKFVKEPTLIQRKKLTVHDSVVNITDITNTLGLTLVNSTDIDIDLEGWRLVSDSINYTFPRYSMIASRGQVIIPQSIHNLENLSKKSWVSLQNNKGRVLHSFSGKKLQKTVQPATTFISETEVTIKDSDIDSQLDRFLEAHPQKVIADFGNAQGSLVESNSSIPISATATAGGIALVLGAVRLYQKSKKEEEIHEQTVIGEIELIE